MVGSGHRECEPSAWPMPDGSHVDEAAAVTVARQLERTGCLTTRLLVVREFLKELRLRRTASDRQV